MLSLLVLLTAILGVVVFCQALKHSWNQWYYGRLNRRTFERWGRERLAESYIRQQTALYRHYALSEVQRAVKLSTGADISHFEAQAIVQRIRDEKGMGPIADYNL